MDVLAACELSGGAVTPPVTLALCVTIRRYAGIARAMSEVIMSGKVSNEELNKIADMMEQARTVEVP
jgi:hypothetical protein